jgi:hypothetical protein
MVSVGFLSNGVVFGIQDTTAHDVFPERERNRLFTCFWFGCVFESFSICILHLEEFALVLVIGELKAISSCQKRCWHLTQ